MEAEIGAELDEALSVPAKATLEEIDLALRTYIYFCARYYRASCSRNLNSLILGLNRTRQLPWQ